MGACSSSCSSSSPTHPIAITGYVGSGKSHLLNHLLTTSIKTHIYSGQTVATGFSQPEKQGPIQHLHSWHYRAGQTQPTTVLNKCSGFIFVIDSTMESSLLSDETSPHSIRSALLELWMAPELLGKPCLILANKQDAYEALPVSTMSDMLRLNELSSRTTTPRLWHIHGCSTLTRANVAQGMEWLTRAISSMPSLSSADRAPDRLAQRLIQISHHICPAVAPVEKLINGVDSPTDHANMTSPTPYHTIPFTPLSRHPDLPALGTPADSAKPGLPQPIRV